MDDSDTVRPSTLRVLAFMHRINLPASSGAETLLGTVALAKTVIDMSNRPR